MKELKVSKTNIDLSEDYLDNPIVYKLNMPVLQAFKALGAKDRQEFEQKLEELGAEDPFFLLASKEDVEDYKKIGSWMPEFAFYTGPEGEKDFYGEALGYLSNLIYKDYLIEENGKFGLKCTTGEVVVPPMFENCMGSNEMLFCDTLAVVEKDGKQWLTPRDGSGRIVSDGYDVISRSYCFGWLENEGKKGLLDSRTGKVSVPCEMDWMEGASGKNWFIGKDNKLGMIDSGFGDTDTSYLKTEYDMIDLSTGQLYKDGKWGWVVDNYEFTTELPKFKDLQFLIFPDFPFNSGESKYWNIKHYLSKFYSGFMFPYVKKYVTTPEERLELPILKLALTGISIPPRVKEGFEYASAKLNKAKDIEFLIKAPVGADFNIMASVLPDDKFQFNICWDEENEDSIAVEEAFPLIRACHRYLRLKDNKPVIRYELDLTTDSLEVPMRFTSSLLSFREKCLEYDEDEWSGLNAIRKVSSDEEPEGWMTPEQLKEQLHKDFEELRKAVEDDE